MRPFDPLPVIHSLWTTAGLPLSRLPELILTSPPGPALASSFRVAEFAQIATALSTLAASYLHELRTGDKTTVTVDKREAGLEFISEAWTLLGEPASPPPSIWDPLAGIYQTSDGYVRVHTNFPHHRTNLLAALDLDPASTRDTLASALLAVQAVPFETLATERGCCVAALRSFDEWDASSQGRDAAERFRLEGAVVVARDGEGNGLKPTGAEGQGSKVAEGVKVLEMTRVIAGPVAGRTMAVRGAQVLLVTSPTLPDLPVLDLDTARGKRTTQLDLSLPTSHSTLSDRLLPSTSIFLQSYRPNALATRFPDLLSPAALRSANPNMILATLSAYGAEGSWAGKRGFDSLVQTASGFNHAEGEASGSHAPKPLPVQALDHAAGQLLTFGMLAALARQYTDGGAYSVRVSLISVAYLLRSLGQYDPIADACFDGPGLAIPEKSNPPAEEIGNVQQVYTESGRVEGDGVRRTMRAVRHAGRLEGLNDLGGKAQGAPMKLDADEARWVEDAA